MAHWQGVAALCAEPNGKRLLMVMQGKPGQPPSWALPGGSSLEGETPEQTVVREVREETGLEVEVVGLFHSERATLTDRFQRAHRHTVHYYEVKATQTALHPRDPDGCVYRAEWVPAERLDELGLSADYEEGVIRQFFASKLTP